MLISFHFTSHTVLIHLRNMLRTLMIFEIGQIPRNDGICPLILIDFEIAFIFALIDLFPLIFLSHTFRWFCLCFFLLDGSFFLALIINSFEQIAFVHCCHTIRTMSFVSGYLIFGKNVQIIESTWLIFILHFLTILTSTYMMEVFAAVEFVAWVVRTLTKIVQEFLHLWWGEIHVH